MEDGGKVSLYFDYPIKWNIGRRMSRADDRFNLGELSINPKNKGAAESEIAQGRQWMKRDVEENPDVQRMSLRRRIRVMRQGGNVYGDQSPD